MYALAVFTRVAGVETLSFRVVDDDNGRARIGSYRKRRVEIKERESVPRKSHCLAPRFALPDGVLKILYSIVSTRLRFEGGGGCSTRARADRRA